MLTPASSAAAPGGLRRVLELPIAFPTRFLLQRSVFTYGHDMDSNLAHFVFDTLFQARRVPREYPSWAMCGNSARSPP